MDVPFMDAGLDSLGAVELRNLLQQAVGEEVLLSSTVTFDHPTARQLSVLLDGGNARFAASPALPATFGSPNVQLSGLSASMPEGKMASINAAGCIAATGSNVVGEVPALRWDVSTLPANSEAVETRRRHGAFLHGVQCFANGAFVISSAEAAATDPQQRLLLERGYAAMHAAEMDRAALQKSLTGVFVGISFMAFEEALHTSPLGGSVYAATGIALSVASGRLYVLWRI